MRLNGRVLSACLFAAFTMWTSPASSQSDIQFGSGIVCDTQKQMERFVALIDGGAEAAVRAVNTEEQDPNACGYATMAYVQGSGLRTMLTRGGTYRIVELLVLGITTGSGLQAVKPTSFFSLIKLKDVEV